MSSLDDLLNSALDELEIQEKETPKPTTTTTTTTTTNTNNNNNRATPSTIKPTYNKQPPPSLDNFNPNDMIDILKNLLNEETIKNLNEGFDKEYNKTNNGDLNLGEEDSKNIDEMAEKLVSMFGISGDNDFGNLDDIKPFLDELTKGASNNNNNNSSVNNTSGVHIDNFESSISDTLKNLAENASNKDEGGNVGLENLFGSLSKLMEGQNFDINGEDSDSINNLFEESIQFMAENYPSWIEKNKNNYPQEEVERFRKQSEIFTMIVQKEGEDILDESLLSKMSELGNLPDSFCEEYLNKMEGDMAKQQEEEKKEIENQKNNK